MGADAGARHSGRHRGGRNAKGKGRWRLEAGLCKRVEKPTVGSPYFTKNPSQRNRFLAPSYARGRSGTARKTEGGPSSFRVGKPLFSLVVRSRKRSRFFVVRDSPVLSASRLSKSGRRSKGVVHFRHLGILMSQINARKHSAARRHHRRLERHRPGACKLAARRATASSSSPATCTPSKC